MTVRSPAELILPRRFAFPRRLTWLNSINIMVMKARLAEWGNLFRTRTVFNRHQPVFTLVADDGCVFGLAVCEVGLSPFLSVFPYRSIGLLAR